MSSTIDAPSWLRPWRRRRPAEPGLNTVADADRFVGELRASLPAGVYGHPIPGRRGAPSIELTRTETTPAVFESAGTPIWDALVAERARRATALRMPTTEMRVAFDALVERWLCSHCDEGDCPACPGCSCPCKLPVGVR